MNVAVRTSKQISRPLKILVPLIRSELTAGNQAGLGHYRRAGEMLLEAREQVPRGRWGAWLSQNFTLSRRTAYDYMALAERSESGGQRAGARTIEGALGYEPRRERHAVWGKLRAAADRVNVDRLANERQAHDDEIKLHRELAFQLIDLGYRALATRLHPDRGGSRDAMTRLNTVRDELKSVAETRRFV